MRILLDTHIALWAVACTGKLPGKALKLLESRDNEVFYSVASVWEVAIKHKIRPEQMIFHHCFHLCHQELYTDHLQFLMSS